MYARHLHQGVRHLFDVAAGNLSATVVVGIKATELYTEYGGLYFVEAAIDAFCLMNIFLARAVVGQCAYGAGKQAIARHHGSTIAQSSEILTWIEAEGGSIAQSAHSGAFVECTVCLGTIFDNLQSILVGKGTYGIHVAHLPVEMHHHDGACAIGDERLISEASIKASSSDGSQRTGVNPARLMARMEAM